MLVGATPAADSLVERYVQQVRWPVVEYCSLRISPACLGEGAQSDMLLAVCVGVCMLGAS